MSFISLNDTDLHINSSLAQDKLNLFISLVIKVKHQLTIITMSQAIIGFTGQKSDVNRAHRFFYRQTPLIIRQHLAALEWPTIAASRLNSERRHHNKILPSIPTHPRHFGPKTRGSRQSKIKNQKCCSRE